MCYSPKAKNQNESGPAQRRTAGLNGLRSPRRTRGVALVVVLSLVVIVSLILVAFVTTMMMDRTASASYGQSVAAEQIGQGAVNLVVAELRNEMGKDALPDLTYPEKPLYVNVSSANILPQKVGTNTAMPNLIKTSTTAVPFMGTLANGTLVASSVSTFSPSTNGRFMDANRWNAPFLGSFPNTASLPNWVIMTRDGATNTGSFGPTGNTLNNPAVDNKSFAIGRFAYAIYDVGGLLDITVAGHPANLTVDQINRLKGTLAGADLTAVGITQVDDLVKWRNAATAATTNAYFNYMTNFVSTNGFSKVASGDTTFLGRQDLIKAAKQNVAGLSLSALTNLTTFTREKNAPSWRPQTPVGSTIDYGTLGKTVSSTNVFIPLVRHTAAKTIRSYQVDGSESPYQVLAGDPLASRRFPLDRIKWLGPNGPQNGGTTENIQYCFGLVWGESLDPDLNGAKVWKYVGATGSTEQTAIKTLAAVLAENREPNFFELLQAAILNGSLALNNGNSIGSSGFANLHQRYVPYHVFKIGASIVSQYDKTKIPCTIEYNQSGAAWCATGTENLPYINVSKLVSGASPDSPVDSVAFYNLIGLWNPHRANVLNTNAAPPIRLRIQGSVALVNWYYRPGPMITVSGKTLPGVVWDIDETITLTQSAASGFLTPKTLTQADVTSSLGAGSGTGMVWANIPTLGDDTGATYSGYAGYRLPDFPLDQSDPELNTAETGDYWRTIGAFLGKSGAGTKQFAVSLEYQQPGGAWMPYSFLNGNNDDLTWTKGQLYALTATYLGYNYAITAAHPTPTPPAPPAFIIKNTPGYDQYRIASYAQPVAYLTVDPRSSRMGPWQYASSSSTYYNAPLWGSATDPAFASHGLGIPSTATYVAQQQQPAVCNNPAGTAYASGALPYSAAWLCRNNGLVPTTANQTTYVDRDGVQRISDSGLFVNAPNLSNWAGNPYERSVDRPIVLDRPFYSVGELGYVGRDYPWKTLDFFTANSADAGLLDIFTVNESNEAVTTGRVDLNGQNSNVYRAVLSNTLSDILGGTSVSQPGAIADRLAAFSSQGVNAPLLGREEIVTKFLPKLSSADTVVEFDSKDEQNIKTRREAVVRALADVGQTRTWNLLIDVVAQAGRYSPTATSADQFVVEGERRYWLHVAIDRFSGEIVDKKLEPYNP